MCRNPQETADLFTFTKDILNGKHHFLESVITSLSSLKYNFAKVKMPKQKLTIIFLSFLMIFQEIL